MERKASTAFSARGFLGAGAACAKASMGTPSHEKPTIRAPPLSTSRREAIRSVAIAASSNRLRCAHHGADDAGVGAAAAEIVCERLFDIGLARLLVHGEKGGGLHNHAVDAIAALYGLFFDKRFLNGMRLIGRAEPF